MTVFDPFALILAALLLLLVFNLPVDLLLALLILLCWRWQ